MISRSINGYCKKCHTHRLIMVSDRVIKKCVSRHNIIYVEKLHQCSFCKTEFTLQEDDSQAQFFEEISKWRAIHIETAIKELAGDEIDKKNSIEDLQGHLNKKHLYLNQGEIVSVLERFSAEGGENANG